MAGILCGRAGPLWTDGVAEPHSQLGFRCVATPLPGTCSSAESSNLAATDSPSAPCSRNSRVVIACWLATVSTAILVYHGADSCYRRLRVATDTRERLGRALPG